MCETTKFTLLLIFIWVELRETMKNTTVLAFLILIGEVMARGGRRSSGRSYIYGGMSPPIALFVFLFLTCYRRKLKAGMAPSAQAKIFKRGFFVTLIAFIILVILLIVSVIDDPDIFGIFLPALAAFLSFVVMLFWGYGYYMTGTKGASFTPAGEVPVPPPSLI